MIKSDQLPAIYLISDRHKSATGCDFWGTLENLLSAGIKIVQLREKDLPATQLYPLACRARELTQRYNALLLINDRVDLALAVKADGVHLGGHSLPTQTVRALAGADFLIGVSTHSHQEIDQARAEGADFVTFGPVFSTPSKAGMGKPVGPESLNQIDHTSFPVYALGGIDCKNIAQVTAQGCCRIAAISALLEAPNPKETVEQFKRCLNL
jgi:thiamine-phosphate pyrophosphorylase